ncbi:protein Hook homolog 3-like isoform X3 [Varroa destructor]|uniref:Protein hook n=1 Tax=Varroa destructor TaxID=109461 RepID=A0A7M7K7V1_VARDE|nr:protein Hook homolog 3-like isoform X3 [Varroa destructor]
MDNFTQSLIIWLRASFDIPVPHSSPEELSDGTALAYVLHQIDGEFFDAQWLNKLKTDCGDNWRLKVSNVKKVIGRVVDYLGDVSCISLILNEGELAQSVGERGRDVGRLLQLVLAAAVNCPSKEGYIQRIMALEEEVQHVVMKAIQELMASMHSLPQPALDAASASGIITGLSGPDVVRRLEERLVQEERARERLEQRLHEIEGILQTERQEKMLLVDELREVQDKMASEEAPQSIGAKVKAQRDQQSKLESELFKMEMQKEEFRSKLEEAQSLARDLTARNEELARDREQLAALKDELDVLRHTNEQVGRYEASLEMYRKKMEEMSDLKKQLKLLEAKNADYLQANVRLEEELSRTATLKTQIEVYKKETHSLHERLTEETERADRAEFEKRRFEEKLTALTAEKDRVLIERDTLRESIEELKLNKQSSTDGVGAKMIPGSSDFLEDSPALLKEKLLRLQAENETLRKRSLTSADGDAYKELHDDLKKLQEETEQKLRAANMKILELESHSADNSIVRDLNDKVEKLTRELEERKQELIQSEEKYDRCIAKARTVLANLNDGSSEAALRHEISEKDQLISKLERDVAQMRSQYDSQLIFLLQERLIMTALHNFGAHEQRRAAEQRLASGSFLNKQRQSTARKHNLSGVQSSEFFN